MLISRIRGMREALESLKMSDVKLAIFLRVYKSRQYFTKIEGWLKRFNLAGAKLMSVDHASTYGTWDWIHWQLIPLLGESSITSDRDPLHVGGYGSLALNWDSSRQK